MHAHSEKIPQQHQRDLPCPVLHEKTFRLKRRANQRYNLPISPDEGRLAIVTNVRSDAVDADVPLTNGT
jgi:hypothetical protein